jgi:hypothetical protein
LAPADETTRLEPCRGFDYGALLGRQDRLRNALFQPR